MATIGVGNKLEIVKLAEFGLYLDGGELGEILLPRRYAPANVKPGDTVDVFVYLDSEDRYIATTQTPLAMVGDFALLKVVSVSPVGAFLDWGLAKDLLVPHGEQNPTMEVGQSYVVRLYVDNTGRIAASAKFEKFLNKWSSDFAEGQEVDLIICNRTDLGYRAIVDGEQWGVLYKNEIFQELTVGQQIEGYIKKIREDGKIDLSLQKPGRAHSDELMQAIVAYLKQNDNVCQITDKSSPEVISKQFKVSKSNYKKALGRLYKNKTISIDKDAIRLLTTQD